MFYVSTLYRFYSLAPKIDLNIMCPELTGCFCKMECHTTGKLLLSSVKGRQMNFLELSEPAGIWKSSGRVSIGQR